MIGLICKNLRAGYITLPGITFYFLASAAAGVIIRSPDFYVIISIALGGSTVGAYLFHFIGGTVEKHEALMPVTPRQIEAARYFAYLIMYVMWLCMLALFTLINYLTVVIPATDETLASTVLSAIMPWSAMSLIFGAVFFPILRCLPKANRIILAVCFVLLFVSLVSFATITIFTVSLEMTMQFVVLGVMFLLLIVSFFVSLGIYKYKLAKGVV